MITDYRNVVSSIQEMDSIKTIQFSSRGGLNIYGNKANPQKNSFARVSSRKMSLNCIEGLLKNEKKEMRVT